MVKQLRLLGVCAFLSLALATVPAISGLSVASAQQAKCSGVVIDATGETVIGASVIIKGTDNGTITDLDGNFAISAKPGDVLVISCIGYVTKEVAFDGNPVKVTLQEDVNLLNEIVVIGYGTQKKVNLTGSVAVIDSKALEDRPVKDLSNALQGLMPGLNLTVGAEGGALDSKLSMNVRGAGTIGDGSASSPLVLIDGLEGDLNTINPLDVESISVLKDAAASSVYGSRAAFGVILITTKSGVGMSGKAKVTYNGNVKFTSAVNVPEFADGLTWAKYINLANRNGGEAETFSAETISNIEKYMNGEITTPAIYGSNGQINLFTGANASTDWYDLFFRKVAPSQEHNLSVTGSSENANYRVSFGYMNQNGLLNREIGEDILNRYTVDAKLGIKLTPWAKLNYYTKWTLSKYDRPSQMGALFYHDVVRQWSNTPAYDMYGNFTQLPATVQQGGDYTDKNLSSSQKVQFLFTPTSDWNITVEGGLTNYEQSIHGDVKPIYVYDVNNQPYLVAPFSNGSYGTGSGVTYVEESRLNQKHFTSNIYSDYNLELGNHNLKFMAGFNAEYIKYDYLYTKGQGLNDPTKAIVSMTTTNQNIKSEIKDYAVAGFFGRINYNYKDRYMVEVDARYDGSSRFVGTKQWGFFPSASVGWNIANEEFAQNWGAVDMLKLRGSWGTLGNTNTTSYYPTYLSMTTGTANGNWLVGGNKTNTAYVPGMVSSSLTWETVETRNIGIDWGFFGSRLTGSFDIFDRYTWNMVGPAPTLPSVLGTSVPKINNCDMRSRGWELEISWRDRIGEVNYGIKGILSDAKQTVLNYPNDTKALSILFWNGYQSNYYSGMELGEIWGYTTKGIAQSQEEMDEWLKNNKPDWGTNWGAGDIMYYDLNGDGKVNGGESTVDNPGDMKVIGNTTPRYNFGITLDAQWRGFDAQLFFQGVGKRDYFAYGCYMWGAAGSKFGGVWQANCFTSHLDYWSEENPDAYYPKPLLLTAANARNQYVQTRYLLNAAYMRLKNAQIGYTLPERVLRNTKIDNCRVYVSGDNLFTIKNMPDQFDPEALDGKNTSGKTYPLYMTVSAGVTITF